jgi:hypothetical protein
MKRGHMTLVVLLHEDDTHTYEAPPRRTRSPAVGSLRRGFELKLETASWNGWNEEDDADETMKEEKAVRTASGAKKFRNQAFLEELGTNTGFNSRGWYAMLA